MALRRKPGLEVVRLMVQSGAPVNKHPQLMLFLLNGDGGRAGVHPDYRGQENPQDLVTEETEVAECAMYLARQGLVERALGAVLTFRGRITTPEVLDNVLECFLEQGAVLDLKSYELTDQVWRPTIMAIFAKKSIVFLEGLPTTIDTHRDPHMGLRRHNAILCLIFQGMASGVLPLTTVVKVEERLRSALGHQLPPDFGPLETLYDFARNPASLSQLARTKIRAQMAECGKFSREMLKKLQLTKVMIGYVQLDDLGDGNDVLEIMRGALPILM